MGTGACFFRLIFERASGAFFFDFWCILGGFGRQQRKPKSISGSFFSDAFFERVLASILGGFLEPRNVTNQQKPLFFQWFLLIFTKSTFSKQVRKNVDLGVVFGSQNPKKSMWKNNTFLEAIFDRFFVVWASEIDVKIDVFSDLFRKCRFSGN